MSGQTGRLVLACWLAYSGIFAVAQSPESAEDLARLRDLADREIQEPTVGRWYATASWKALIRLAQLGDDRAAAKVVSVARREASRASTEGHKNSADILVILQHVASIRRPEAIDFLKEHLDSDERLPTLDGGVPGTLVSQRAAVLLASLLDGFPVKKEYYADYTSEDLHTCRVWMNSHKGQWSIAKAPAANDPK